MEIDSLGVDPNVLSKSIAFMSYHSKEYSSENAEIFADLRKIELSDPKISYKLEGNALRL